MLNIYKFQSGYDLFTTLCIVGDSNLAGICEYLTSSRGLCCKNESIVIVISGNWEYETGLFFVRIFDQDSTAPVCRIVRYLTYIHKSRGD